MRTDALGVSAGDSATSREPARPAGSDRSRSQPAATGWGPQKTPGGRCSLPLASGRPVIDVLFSHSYYLRFDPKEFRAMMPYPPLGTLYAAACARDHGFTVALADSMLAASEDHLENDILAYAPGVVVIYDDDFNYLTKMCLSRMRAAAHTMSSIAKRHGCTVVIHGPDSADHADAYLAHGADFVLCGEGEQTLVELLTALLRGGGNVAGIPGLAYADGGRIVRTGSRDAMRDLDRLPFPAWDLIDAERYRAAWTGRHGYFSLNMVTTRGCPFHCNWCAKPIYGQAYHSRSPANVVAEMKVVNRTLRPDHLWFCDDIFGLKPGWIREFSETLKKENLRIPFKCLARADLLLKDDAVRALRDAGCSCVWIGAESGSQKVLDAMEKGTTVAQIYEASRQLRGAGISVGFFVQFGYPGETRDDIALTLKMLKDCRPDEMGISVSYPLPGTKFYESVRAQLGEKRNWITSEDLDLMFAGTFVPDFYRILHRVTHKKLRIWQGQAFLRDTFRRRSVKDRRRVRTLAAALYHLVTLPPLQVRLRALSQRPRLSPLSAAGV